MEGKGEQGGSQTTKLLETLKKHVLDVSSDSSGDKGLSSHEVCTSFVELSDSIYVAAQKPNASQLISHAVELLVRACSSPDHHIRLSASENLRKLIKSLMNTHLSRLQEDLFHELKKNGTSRSLCVALDCYASLFRLTRLSKRSTYAQNLVPILFRLSNRQEEALHEALQEAFKKILPIMTPCLPAATVQFLMKSFVDKLPAGSSTFRRMTSSAIVLVLAHCKTPSKQAEWLLNKLLDMGTKIGATSGMVHGVLLIIQQLCSKMSDINPPSLVMKQAYSFSVSCLLHRDTNTAVSALEALHQLLSSASVDVQTWLVSSLPNSTVAANYWFSESTASLSSSGTSEDQKSLEGLELPCDTYFDSDQSVTMRLAGAANEEKGEEKSEEVSSTPSSQARPSAPADEVVNPKTDIIEAACLAIQDGPDNPLGNIVKYLIENVLSSSRVSSQSLALACITVSIDICPTVLPSLDSLEAFTTAQDPKLRSRVVMLIATVISSNLRASRGDFSSAPAVVNVAEQHLNSMLGVDTPMVLKAVCEALQLCIPVLIRSTQPSIVGDIIHKLLPLCESSYWLTKVELLQTLGCLDFTSLATFAPSLPETVLKGVVFKLLADSDHRVRSAASECLVLLASNIQLRGDPILAHAQWQSTQLLSHLHPSFIQLSLAGIADTFVKVRPRVPLGLDHILWFLVGNISTSVDVTLQRGCLEALHALSVNYPPPSLADEWGCSNSPCTLIGILHQLLTSSKLIWSIQAHCELLELTNSVFLGCALSHMHQQTPQGGSGGGNWCALTDPTLCSQASTLFKHNVKLLCVFVHVVEQKEPEVKEKRVQLHVSSPRKTVTGDSPSPSKPKAMVQDALHKLPFTAKDGIGQFAGSAHYMKMYDACKAAYTNYRVTLDPIGQDKFSTLLQICHNSLATVLEVSLADDVCEKVEEILSYLGCTVKIDPSGALLCVQQLLNALFGMNTAAQHTHIYSPYVSSLPYDITPARSPVDSDSLYEVALTGPISLLTTWLQPFASSSPAASSQEKSGGKKRHGFLPLKKALVMKPVNSVSSIKDYIGYFEPLVVHSLNRFPYTSSTLLQQRVLFLLVQLLNLKVRYELLDCNHLFLESVMKMVSLLESGIVRGGELLVPHLFQFLVLLAYDTSSLVTIPQVIQRCDGVMASGHNVTTFAIPALKPLVLNLFVRPSKDNPDLETQREVVLNMLLRLVDNSGVIVLLTYVLDCYQRNRRQWQHVSTQIYAALLPRIGRLEVALDNKESLVVLYQLFSAMDPHIINIQALLGVVLKQQSLKTPSQLLRWLNIICTTYQLMITIFPESTFQQGIQTLQFAVPELDCALAHVDKQSCSESSDKITQLAEFVRGTLFLAASALCQVNVKHCSEDYELLPLLTVNMLLMVQSVIQGHYHKLRGALSSLPASASLTEAFIQLSTSYPLLSVQYANLSISLYGRDQEWVHKLLTGNTSESAGNILIQHAVFLLICENWQFAGVFKQPQNDTNTCVAISKSPVLLKYCQEEIVRSFLCSKNKDSTVIGNLFDQLKSCNLSSPTQCLKALQLASVIPSSKSLQFICTHLLSHPISVITTTATRVAIALMEDKNFIISDEEVSDLIDKLKSDGESSSIVLKNLELMSGKTLTQPSSVESPETRASVRSETIEKTWYLNKLHEFFVKSNASANVSALLLGRLDQESLTTVIHSERFPIGLLESCITHGVLLSLNKTSAPNSIQQEFSPSSVQDGQLHPLLQASVNRLLQEIVTGPSNSDLTHPLVRLLSARHQLPNCVTFNDDSLKSIAALCQSSLLEALSKTDPLAVQSAMDCCSLALHCSEVQQSVSEDWVCQVVSHLFKIITRDHPVTLIGSEESDSEQTPTVLSTAKAQLFSVLQVLLHPASLSEFESLRTSIESLTFALCRLPLVHSFIMTPPVLMVGGAVSEKVLDQGLMESEVLFQYMQRCNSVGWLNRPQFEERWMQLLGVINQPPPMEGTHPEEYQAHSLNVCAGLQAVTSLLLTTTLRPHLGDPTASVPMHTHRIGDMLFLGSKPGRKLAQVRKILEYQLLLQCGVRSNLYSYYQSPLSRHLSSPHYPPIFTWNIERLMGDSSLGSGQMALNSLWPILLSQVVPQIHQLEKTTEVDVKSCILSLVDLFTHWLSHPIHTLLLHHVLQSIVMLSDLFALSGHFEWMLKQFLDLFEQHPQEDMTVMSLAIQGILKAAAVLKVTGPEAERVAKAVEKSLSTDSAIIVQTACICGMLYTTEYTGSEVVVLTLSTLTKVILGHLQNSKRFTEAHTSLVWSLAVNLLMNHSNQIKDANFSSQLLDQVLPLLSQPDLSTSLFHSVCTGLELLVVNFSLYSHDRNSVATAAARWFVKSDHSKSLAALSLLLTCMYTGEEASVVSGLAASTMDPMETALQSREHVNNLMERLRHGPLVNVGHLVHIMPQLIVDFLSPMEVLQLVVTDFVSPHQTRPQLSGTIMAEVFSLLMSNGDEGILMEWILLSMDSFAQLDPEMKAVRAITCLLTAASTAEILRSVFPLVCYDKVLSDDEDVTSLLQTACQSFYAHCAEQQQEQFFRVFKDSKYSLLNSVSQRLIGQQTEY